MDKIKMPINKLFTVLLVFSLQCSEYLITCSDITNNVFSGSFADSIPAAFGDFNSDELTDVFVIRDKGKTVEIFLAAEEEPLLGTPYKHLKCNFTGSQIITSVVPGDFDGDALMDMLVTVKHHKKNRETDVYIMWGGATYLNCSDSPVLTMIGQPLAIDYNQDMIVDLFGMDIEERRTFWIFHKDRTTTTVSMHASDSPKLKDPHSHSFLDLNEDFTSDLFLTTTTNFEIWNGTGREFVFNRTIEHPIGAKVIGQSLFVDVELRGRMDLLTPICFDYDCKNSTLLVYSDGEWHNLQVNFKEGNNNWQFYQNKELEYTDTITLHSGDFNMDGYPDILATLSLNNKPQSFLLENVPCDSSCGHFKRSYVVRWDALQPFTNGTIMAAFFDFYQDGVLDIIMVKHNGSGYKTSAFKNSLDYDANFIKVMVLTGLGNNNSETIMGRVGKKRRTYGTNLPGPRVSYKITTQEDDLRHAASAQLPQSAHFSLNLPYNIFGLGRTPNFVDLLSVGLYSHSREWTQIIPNSQMVVIPWPVDKPVLWKAQLFVTPSKLILMSVGGLTTACALITIIIGVLHWKERQEDKKERLSESHRFHFDAM